MASQRLLIAMAAQEDLKLFQVDIKNAYLNGEIVLETNVLDYLPY